MLLFWLIACMMMAFAVGMIILPLWRGGQSVGGRSHETEEVMLYRQRLAEIEYEQQAGLLSEAEYQRVKTELNQQLLMDVGTDQQSARARKSNTKRWPIAVTAMLLPLVAIGLYVFLGGPSTVFSARSSPTTDVPPNMQAMVARLAERLEKHPDNGRGWLMLGRSYLVLERAKKAVSALERAHHKLGDKPVVLLTLARALAAARRQPSLLGRPARLIMRALKKAPNNAEALWLAGLVAVEKGKDKAAARYWQSLLSQQGPDSPIAGRVRSRLAEVRARMEDAGSDATASQTGTNVRGK